MEYTIKDMSEFVLNKQYKLLKKLGAGAFGEIYSIFGNVQDYSIKIERSDTKHPQLLFESKLYQYLNNSPIIGIPKFYGFYQQDSYNFFVMEQLGKILKSFLQTIIVSFNYNQSLFYTINVTIDIKLDNLILGKSHKERVYMVDYGLAKNNINKVTHIPYKDNKALTGTARYASINTHLGIEHSRRDDLESL